MAGIILAFGTHLWLSLKVCLPGNSETSNQGIRQDGQDWRDKIFVFILSIVLILSKQPPRKPRPNSHGFGTLLGEIAFPYHPRETR